MTSDLIPEWGKKKLGSAGRAVGECKVRVINQETGAVLPAGAEGLLEVLVPSVSPNWARTSDIGVIDEDGFVFIKGRADGAIVRGGFKILPEGVESALLKHPAVHAAAVVGIADHRLGQVPAAAIELKEGVKEPSPEELEAHLRNHVPAPHIPVMYRFVKQLPRTSSMKVARQDVKALLEQR
jgi:acyl-coenzyme A synthetase/AMP-(fatty) acid ligase